MNIIISVGFFSKKSMANYNIALNLARELVLLKHTCHLVGISYNEESTTEIMPNLFVHKIQHIKALKMFVLSQSHNVSKLQFSVFHPFCAANIFLLRFNFFHKLFLSSYENFVLEFSKSTNSSVIIAVSFPFDEAYYSISNKYKGLKIYYQLDPFGLHINSKSCDVKSEVKLIEKSDIIITTKCLYKEYQHHEKYKLFSSKMVAQDFPVLVQNTITKAESVFKFSNSNINMLFCGTLDDNYRNPQLLFNIMKPILMQNKNIRMYFLGDLRSVPLDNTDANISKQIFTHTQVDPSVAYKTMLSADVLINIGNNIYNMVPSKIFDYFSTGKPVLNIQKISNCPAQEYIDKYPLQYTIKEFENFTKAEEKELATFINSCKNSKLEYSDVEQIYYQATPKYVVNKLLEAIET